MFDPPTKADLAALRDALAAGDFDAVLKTLPKILEDYEELHGELLRHEMSEISRKHFGARWAKDLEFKIWRTFLEDPEKLSQQEVDKLERHADICGGWWKNEGLEEDMDNWGDPEFVELEAWEKEYAAHARGTQKQSTEDLRKQISELQAKLAEREKT